MQRETSVVINLMAESIYRRLGSYTTGHCVRIDDASAEQAAALVGALRDLLDDEQADVWRLASDGDGSLDIAAERAVELRNRKRRPLVLFVPSTEGHAASSLDNSFERLSYVELNREAAGVLRKQLESSLLDESLRILWRLIKAWVSVEDWVDFLATVSLDPTDATFGRELWRVGLVPDLGPNPESRLEANARAARAITRPSRTVATVSDRLVAAGVRDDPMRNQLEIALGGLGALSRGSVWTRALLSLGPDKLTFERWPLVESVSSDLSEVVLVPFLAEDGKPDKSSKLGVGSHGQLICEVPVDGSAEIVVQWRTNPPKIDRDVLAHWVVEVLPPSDLRTEDSSAIGSARVAGSRRRATVKVAVSEDDLASGTRFVARLSAEDVNGQPVALASGEDVDLDSQEFEVVIKLQAADPQTRKATAGSIAEASLRAAVDGIDDRIEDMGGWDLDRGIFSVRLGGRRIVQIQVAPLLVGLQRRLIDAEDKTLLFEGMSSSGRLIEDSSVTEKALDLPPTLGERRARVMSLLKGRTPRDTVESLLWDDELRAAVNAYVATYRRALDAAQGQSRIDLLRMETLTVNARVAGGVTTGVVLLPLHPLRLAWASAHDRLLHSWAHALEGLPKAERPRSVDKDLLARITPANLPFSLLSSSEKPMVYFDELTFASGLYLDPRSSDPEADATVVSAAIGLPRRSASTRFAAAAVAERIEAYTASHATGAGLRLISVSPGGGEVLADACRQVLRADDDSDVDPLRMEILAYSDRTSYIAPLQPLGVLQSDLRLVTRDKPGSHLAPPLSLSVRPLEAILDDDSGAHLAVLQGLAQSALRTTATTPDRAPSLGGLLVPTVFDLSESGAGVQVVTQPALGNKGGSSEDLTGAHRAHQAALGATLAPQEPGFPALFVEIRPDSLARLSMVHARADWVLTLDRQIGVGLFDSSISSGLHDSFILDYAPDFIDGIGDRLTVTTVHRGEVELILAQAMRDLDLETIGRTQNDVLTGLGWVSGRLALRLLGDTTLAREAVSLAALMLHLQDKAELEGAILIPVDAHPELFGPTARDGDVPARRCDLILVRVGQRSFKIEYIEVKARRRAQLPQALADTIVEQLESTQELLNSLVFAQDPAREDAPLQWARWAGLLHYYADRSGANGFIDPDRLEDLHRYIDRVEEQRQQPDVSLRGFVVSVEGAAGFPRKVRDVPITVLTAHELGRLGFTTLMEAQERQSEPPFASEAVSRSGDADPSTQAEASDDAVDGMVPKGTPAVAAKPNDDSSGAVEGFAADDAEAALTPTTEGALAGGRSAGQEGGIESSVTSMRESAPTAPSTSAETSWAQPPGIPEVTVELGQDASNRPVRWQVSTKGSPHAFILGIPGQGKSVTTRKILKDFANQGLPALVLDFHGDMAAQAANGVKVVDASQGLPFSPFETVIGQAHAENHSAWEVAEILAVVFGLGEIQRNNVYRALQQAYSQAAISDSVPSMTDFITALEAVEANARGKNARARLTPFSDFGLFAEGTAGAFNPIAAGGTILDVSGLGLEQVQLAAGAFLLRKVYNDMFQWPQNSEMRLAVVLDEAHRLARDVTLPRLMKEGRKYGVSVVVASQGVEDFHQQVLENAGTKIVFRTNFPASKKVAGFLRGRGGQDLSEQIELLGVGQAYVATPDHAQARKVYMQM